MKFSIKNIIKPQSYTAILMLSLVFVVWVLAHFVGFNHMVEDELSVLKTTINFFGTNYRILALLATFALTIINTVLIQQINKTHIIIRTRTFLPVLIFNILIAVSFRTHGHFIAHIALTFIMLAVYVVLGMYRNKNAVEHAFLGGLFLALASFFIKPLLLLVFVFWIGFFQLKSFSLRTLLASTIGLLLPWIFYFFFSFYYCSNYLWLTELFRGFEVEFLVPQLPLNQIIYLSFMTLVLFVSLAGLYSNLQSDSIQTRVNIMFLSVFSVAVFSLFFIFSKYYIILVPTVIFSAVFVLAHPFSLRKTNFQSILFILFILANLAFVVSNIL